MKHVFTFDSLIDRLCQRNISIQTVVDIGASDGTWSIKCHKYLPHCIFLAIDPLREREPSLRRLKEESDWFNYCIAAAGEDKTEVCLNVTEDLDGSTIDGQNEGVSRTVETISLDQLMEQFLLPGPYLLKFDTHGYEIPILNGAKKVLSQTNAIIMEMHNFQLTKSSLRFSQMCSYMEELDFRVADIADPMLRKHDQLFWQLDVLLLPKNYSGFSYPHYA